jgi:small subunit ribosomal protein S17
VAQETTTSRPAQSPRPEAVKRTGVVDSIAGPKTVRIVLRTLVKHPLYGKYMRRRTRLMAHDPKGQAKIGDTVEVAQCRPISKRKSWRLVRVVKRAVAT